jgi:hypothetical protein
MTAAEIAEVLGMALLNASRWLARIGWASAAASLLPSRPTATSESDTAPLAIKRSQLGSPSWNNVLSNYS